MVCVHLQWVQRITISCLSPSDTVLYGDEHMPGWCKLSHVTYCKLFATYRRSNPAFQLLKAHQTWLVPTLGQEVVHCLLRHSRLRNRCRRQTNRLPSPVQRVARRSFCNTYNWHMLQRCRLLFLSKSHLSTLLHTDWFHLPSAAIGLGVDHSWECNCKRQQTWAWN